ncbi:sugar phosphate nucleotidyltransferase [Euzebya rosea]|uniref:sugar phosphate nucleotidyltransferase n=1 Tax=Euzebya rosea TaxID=2052804 RepID=UPI000D3EC1D6|nr:sugar phosphate nucleotidyltransferase [Euzebya rosea]
MGSTDRLDPADIPVVILAGGFGMRLHEETERVPKPMVQIGTKPILWHIMRHYSTYGFRRFTICLGYKSWAIKEYFLNYHSETADLRVQLGRHSSVEYLGDSMVEDWEITLVETGLNSGSTGRLQGVQRYIDTPYFMYTYGDGVGTVDLDAVHSQHVAADRLVTVTGVKPMSRYGLLLHDGERVTAFDEKPEIAEGYVSGGFFALSSGLFDRLDGHDPTGFMEIDVLPGLVTEGQVGMHRHHGFWHSMDTYRDYVALNDMWDAGDPPWRTWKDEG